MTQVQKHLRDVDLYRTYIAARATQGGGKWQVARAVAPDHLRRQHRADWTRIDPAIRVTANLLVDRTNVQTRSTAYAEERFAQRGVCQHLNASIVENHKVKLFRSFVFRRGLRARQE